MALTYGIIGDRLSDLVGEMKELKSSAMYPQTDHELTNILNILDGVRGLCDALSFPCVSENN